MMDDNYKKAITATEPDVMQPDLLITCDHDENTNETDRYMGTPTLVVEILSPSTRSKDMFDKLNTYMLSGVQGFWIVDPKKMTVMVYVFKDRAIEEFSSYKLEDTVSSVCLEGLIIACKDIFAY